MGKRKSNSAKPKLRMSPKLSTIFDCPFCNHSRCVETKLEKKRALGTLYCRICNASYSMRITALTEPIDVYSDWIDRCEEENRAQQPPSTQQPTSSTAASPSAAADRCNAQQRIDDKDEDDVEQLEHDDSDGDGEDHHSKSYGHVGARLPVPH